MSKKEQSVEGKDGGIYLPLPEIKGYLSFDEVEKGRLLIKVKDLSAAVKKMVGVDFRKVSTLIIEEEGKEE